MSKIFKITDVLSDDSENTDVKGLEDYDFSLKKKQKILDLSVNESITFHEGEYTIACITRLS